jgi:hypothetical protein
MSTPRGVRDRARALLLRPSEATLVAFCGLLIALQALLAFGFASKSAFNYTIYRDIATFVNVHADLPSQKQSLGPNITGSYADFTAMNLTVYRALFWFHAAQTQRAVYLAYEALN